MPESVPSSTLPTPLAESVEHPFADLDRLGNEIAELSAHIQAATYRLLVLIREFDARSGWNTGFRSCAHWLNWRTGLEMGAAREKVRVARALGDLPRLSRAMRRGEISYSKVRALTRVATPDSEAELLEFALSGTAAHVERLVRAWRRVDRLEAMEQDDRRHTHRYLRSCPDEDGMLVVRARLTPEVGAVFAKALEAASEVLYQQSRETDGPSWSEVPAEQRRADALELLAESALAGGLDPGTAGDRYQVVVHVQTQARQDVEEPDCVARKRAEPEASDLASGLHGKRTHVSAETPRQTRLAGPADRELENGLRVSAETSRRLACDSSRVVMTHGSEGSVLDVGRKTRVVHPALRRALRYRDGSCRFPGCGLHICDAHHVEQWAEGGKTRLDNLLLLCRRHHRALHEGGFRVELEADGACRFYSPKGWRIPEAPPVPRLAASPVVALTRRHWQDGIEIDASTGFPRWQGEDFDLGYAIDALRKALPAEPVAADPSDSCRSEPVGSDLDVSAATSPLETAGRRLPFEARQPGLEAP